jgi:SAM-dependent methyltransferase
VNLRRYPYDVAYYRRFSRGAARSAEVVLPLLRAVARVRSVVDFGCGSGAWLAEWQHLGVDDVLGLDAEQAMNSLTISAENILAADLRKPIRLGRRFDLAQSLEVAEHLPPDSGPVFVETLTAHAPLILFSAAVPGQGGEHHLNEQTHEYWRHMFSHRAFELIDVLRPFLANNRVVEPWYRYNTLLFAHDSIVPYLSEIARAHRVPDEEPVADYWPLYARLRMRLIRHIPSRVVTAVALAMSRGCLWRR